MLRRRLKSYAATGYERYRACRQRQHDLRFTRALRAAPRDAARAIAQMPRRDARHDADVTWRAPRYACLSAFAAATRHDALIFSREQCATKIR